MPTTKVTPRRLRQGARLAWKLDALLYNAMDAKAMPLLIGFHLDYLATQFEQAADRMEAFEQAGA